MSSDTDTGSNNAAAAIANDSNGNDNQNDAAEPRDVDQTTMHTFIFETATSDVNTKSLTDAGVNAIANHKYKPGKYTFLDNLLNPIWTGLTELLPMWLAPNMVTVLGALHCGISFGVTWYHTPNFDTPVPDWVMLLSGYCTIAYYTFDCMDGKQARRTGQSSPLGQLFDHGFDCLCNLSHISNQAAYLMVGGTRWLLALEGSLFFCFFMAQWEEYYTGELPHSMGNFGVTEVNYALGLFAIGNSFIDREKFWSSTVGDILPTAISSLVPSGILGMEARHIGLTGWNITSFVLIMGSFYRVLKIDFVTTNNLQMSAVSKLATPFLIAIAPFLLSPSIIEKESRTLMISQGLLMSFLTMKMICFSMAKQSFASIQMEAFPYFAIIIILKTDASNHSLLNDTAKRVILSALCVWYAYRLIIWASKAIDQICKRLDIYCFSIKHPKTKSA